ncbi:hypothetical protein [Nonomuraea sp. NPDC049028]|uniref:hypothetical protein n=1 Tax=Nonomuraea sp. NPDC049028 TaxID=3364348 RepID=UPI003711D18C
MTLAGAMLVGGVWAWARRSTSAADTADTDADVKTAAQVLAGLVERQWRDEARHRPLDNPEPIPVHWKLIAEKTVIGPPDQITPGDGRAFTGRSHHIAALADAFRALKRRRLVIAGGAGMGKTTLAIQLLLQLLATRAADQAAAAEGEVVPVPVLLPVSGWDTGVHPRLQDWLAVRLTQDYPALTAPQLGSGAAAALAEGGHILPVLDGLDEIPVPARARVIDALNASLTARDQLILTSRRTEFTTAVHEVGRPLNAAAVIVPKPITPHAAADYLTACLFASPSDAWTQVLTALRSRAVPGLSELAATPLGLWLIRAVYLTPGADPAPLTGPLGRDADALRAHLLDRLIPALIKARPPSTDPTTHFRPRHRLDPDATRRHLTYLARAFPPVATRDIAWWRIASTTPHIQSAVGLTFGLTIGLTIGLMFGLGVGLGVGLAVALISGIVGLACARDWANDTPGCANLRLRGRTLLLLRSIRGGLGGALKVGLWAGLVVGLQFGLVVGLVVGLIAGAMAWIAAGPMSGPITVAIGLIKWAEQPTLTSTSTSRSSWQADGALTLLRMVLVGLVFGVTGGLEFGLAAALLGGLAFGPLGGLVMGNHNAWLVCTIAVSRLTLQHRLPWRIMEFLDDVHRLGLLRAVGPVYQFRHAALHDHLAAADTSSEAS